MRKLLRRKGEESRENRLPYSSMHAHENLHKALTGVTNRRTLAEKCLDVAHQEGVKNVRLGNVHLLV